MINFIFNLFLLRYTLFENGKVVKVTDPHLLDKLEKTAEYDLTLVVPAYNEESRLPVMMKDTINVIIVESLFIIIIISTLKE